MKESDPWEWAHVDILRPAANTSPHMFFFSMTNLVMLQKFSIFSVDGSRPIDKFLTFLEKSLKYGLHYWLGYQLTMTTKSSGLQVRCPPLHSSWTLLHLRWHTQVLSTFLIPSLSPVVPLHQVWDVENEKPNKITFNI